MAGFIEGIDRGQSTLFPERLEDWVGEDHLVRVVDLFVEELDLSGLGFEPATPARTGRPGYHPAVLLKLFVYGYLNQVPSSRRLEREAGRNVELMWLTGRLVPDHKTIADFRRDNGPAIRRTCAQFVELCRRRPAGRLPRHRQQARPTTVIRSSMCSAPRLPIAVVPSDAVRSTSSAWPSPQCA